MESGSIKKKNLPPPETNVLKEAVKTYHRQWVKQIEKSYDEAKACCQIKEISHEQAVAEANAILQKIGCETI